MRRSIPRDNDKAQRDFRINRTEKLAARARRTERALRALEVVDKPWEGWDLRFTIDQAPRSGAVVARLGGRRGPSGRLPSRPVHLEIGWADRVALIGPNGSGKTTLIERAARPTPPDARVQRLGPSVVVGELGQDRRVIGGRPDARSMVMTALTGVNGQPRPVRCSPSSASAPTAALRRPSSLSPGERTRAELAALRRQRREFPGPR